MRTNRSSGHAARNWSGENPVGRVLYYDVCFGGWQKIELSQQENMDWTHLGFKYFVHVVKTVVRSARLRQQVKQEKHRLHELQQSFKHRKRSDAASGTKLPKQSHLGEVLALASEGRFSEAKVWGGFDLSGSRWAED